jgi:hypothetical protein
VQYRGASGAVLLYVSFSLNARSGSTRPKDLKISNSRTWSLLFWLNARLRSTRPKNLKAGRQCNTVGRASLLSWLDARLGSTRPKNLKRRSARDR